MVAVRTFAAVTALLALVQAYAIGLGILGVRLTQQLAVLGLGLAIAGAIGMVVWCGRAKDGSRAGAEGIAAVGASGRWAGAALAAAALGWLAWLGTQLFRVAYHRHPIRWDELWYHVPVVHEWAVRGGVFFYPLDPRFAGVPDQIYFAGWLNFPMGVELSGLFAFRLLGTDRLIDATNLWYWPLAVTALAVLAGQLGARGGWQWLAGGLLFSVSEFLAQSATLYVDAGFAATVIAAIAAGAVFVFDTRSTVWWKAALLGLAVGLMVGSKGPGLPYGGVILGASLTAAVWRRGWQSWRALLLPGALAGSLVVGIGGYWSIRNLVHTGNPIYPIQISLGRKVIRPGYDVSGYGSRDWVLDQYPTFKRYPAWTRMFAAWLQPDLRFRNPGNLMSIRHSTVGGLGYLWLLGAVPAIAYLWFLALRRRRDLLPPLAFVTVLVILLLSMVQITWQARFVYWLHGLGLPAFSAVLAYSWTRARARAWHLLPLALGAGVVGVAVWESREAVALEWRIGRDGETEAGEPRFRAAIELLWPWMPNTDGFRDLLSADRVARSTWKGEGAELFNGVLAMPIGKREIVVLPPRPTERDLDLLAARGWRWVLWQTAEGEEVPPAVLRRAARTVAHRAGRTTYHAIELAPAGAGLSGSR